MDAEAAVFDRYLKRPSRRRYRPVVERFYRFVWGIARRTSGDAGDALDLTHDVFLSLLLRPPAPGTVRSPRGYLAARVLALARRSWQAGERRRAREIEAARRLACQSSLDADDVDALRTEMDRLPERVREVLELRYFAGLENREVARAVGLSERSVEEDLRRGRELLRVRLRKELLGTAALPLSGPFPAASGAGPPPELLRELLRLPELALVAPASTSVPFVVGGILVKKLGIAVCVTILLVGLLGWLVVSSLENTDVALDGSNSGSGGAGSGELADSGVATDAKPAPPLAPETGAPPLHVRVVWSDTGEPVAAAAVRLRDALAARGRGIETVTGADGIARLTPLGTWSKARIEVEALAVTAVQEVMLPEDEPVTVRLAREAHGEILGRVLDASTRTPIAGATVVADDEHAAKTDGAGEFRLAPLRGGRYRTIASAEGYLAMGAEVAIRSGARFEHEFYLDPAVPLEVTVVGEEGRPLPGVTVSRAQIDGSYLGSENTARQTDAAGVAVIEGLSRLRPQQVRAEKDGYKTAWRRPPGPEPWEDVARLRVVLERERSFPRTVRGRVADSASRGIAGARVTWSQTWGSPQARDETVTDANGAFELRFHTDHDTCHIVATAPGWAPAVSRNVGCERSGEPAEVELILEQAHWLHGVIVDEDGSPVEGARILAMPDAKLLRSPARGSALARRATADRDGRFALLDLAGPTVALEVKGPPGESWSVTFLEDVAVEQAIEAVLTRNGEIRGRVVGEDGEPVTVFRVRVKPRGEGWPPGLWYPRTQAGESFAAPDGRFVLEDLPRSHRYDLIVEAPDLASAVLADVEPAPPELAEEHRIEVTPGAAVRGVLLDAVSGAPIPAGTVLFGVWDGSADRSDSWAWLQKRDYQRAVTADDGRFEFREKEPGTLLVLAAGYQRLLISPKERVRYAGASAPEPVSELRIRLEAGVSIEGVHFEGGEPKPHVYVDLVHLRAAVPSGELEREFLGGIETDGHGRFRWDSLEPGSYLVHHYRKAESPGEASKPALRLIARVDPVAGEARSMTFGDELGTLAFEGTLLDENGKPVEGVELSVEPRFPWKYIELTTPVDRKNGAFRFRELVPGEYHVSYVRNWRKTPLGRFEITADRRVELVAPSR